MPQLTSTPLTISPYHIQKIILEQSKRANVGHIGSALSIAHIMAALYGQVLKIPHPQNPDRDRFILSKGHAALALYAVLFLKGWISQEELNTFCADDSRLGVHPEHDVNGIEFSTGSLGHGLAYGIGTALAAKKTKAPYRTFVLLSDAECNEGSVWEGAMFAGHHQLSNLICVIDCNGQQAMGYTKDVLDLQPLSQKWQSFGWDVHEIDGHDVNTMVEKISLLNTADGSPHMMIARTTFGKGVSYMENKIKWHYWPMSEEEYKKALKEISVA